MIGIRTEKAIKKIIALLKEDSHSVASSMMTKKDGNVFFRFIENEGGNVLAQFSLKSIISKRYAKRKKK